MHTPVAAVGAVVAASVVTAATLIARTKAAYQSKEEDHPNEIVCRPRVRIQEGKRRDLVHNEP